MHHHHQQQQQQLLYASVPGDLPRDPAVDQYLSTQSSTRPASSLSSTSTLVDPLPAHEGFSKNGTSDTRAADPQRAKITWLEEQFVRSWMRHQRPRWHEEAARAFKIIDVKRWQQATELAKLAGAAPSPPSPYHTLTQADYKPGYIYPRGHPFRQPNDVLEERRMHANWEQSAPALDAQLLLHPEMDAAVFHQPPAPHSIRPTWSNFFDGSFAAPGMRDDWRARSPLSELHDEATADYVRRSQP